MPTTDPDLARAAWRAALAEHKARERRVRTPEGARRFGQPIGSVIRGDVDPGRLLPTPPDPQAARRPAAEDDLRSYVRLLETMRDGTAEAVTRHGRWYAPAERPSDIQADQPQRCFQNALQLAQRRDELTYVEGIAMAEIGGGTLFPTHHAWCVDADGRVVDPTWPDGVAYYGVPFDTTRATEAVVHQGYWGLLGNQPACRERLESGDLERLIPPDAPGLDDPDVNPPTGDPNPPLPEVVDAPPDLDALRAAANEAFEAVRRADLDPRDPGNADYGALVRANVAATHALRNAERRLAVETRTAFDPARSRVYEQDGGGYTWFELAGYDVDADRLVPAGALHGHVEGDTFYVKLLSVPPHVRRRGAASILMDHLGAWAAKRGLRVNHGSRTDDGRAWWDAYAERRRAAGLQPPTGAAAETPASAAAILAAAPWHADRAALAAGLVPGIRVDPNLRDGVAGHRRSRAEGVVTVSPSFLDDDPLSRFVLIAHEIGHDVANELMRTDNERGMAVLAPFRKSESDVGRYDNPFGLSEQPGEVLADAYQELLTFGLDNYQDPDSEYSRVRRELLLAVAETATAMGLPASRSTERPNPPTTTLPDPGPTLDVAEAHALLPAGRSKRIRKRKAAVKFYAKRRDGADDATAQRLADEYERAALQEALDAAANGDVGDHDPEPLPAKPVKAKLPKIPAAAHPPSDRPDPYADPLTRGGDGPAWGYRAGDEVLSYHHGAWTLHRVVDDSAETEQHSLWATSKGQYGGEYDTGKKRLEHTVLLEQIPTRKARDGKPIRIRYAVEDLVPAAWVTDPVRVDPGFELDPTLDAVDAASLPLERLMPGDSYERLLPILKRRAVALDSPTEAYHGFLLPDKLALAQAKEDALRSLGRAFGFTDADTDRAIELLRDEFLGSWLIRGDMSETRRRMNRAMQRLRSGEPADDADSRALLLQKAWSNATWDRRYKPGETPRIHRFVTGSYAAQIEAFVHLSRPQPDGEPPLLELSDVTVNAWPLSSWTATPAGVHSGWIGKERASIELSMEVTREETWLNVWSEEQFRTRGLKAPGEFIIDDRHELNLARVDVTVHRPPQETRYGAEDDQAKASRSVADSVRRSGGERQVHHVLAGAALLSFGSMRTTFFPRTGLGDPTLDDSLYVYDVWPDTPQTYTVYRDKKTGERFDRGPGEWRRFTPDDEDDTGKWVSGRELIRDDRGEERLDRAADFVARHDWTYNQLSRLRDAAARLMRLRRDEALYRAGKVDAYFSPKTPAEHARWQREHERSVQLMLQELREANAPFGLVTVDDAWFEAQVAAELKRNAAQFEKLPDAPAKVSG